MTRALAVLAAGAAALVLAATAGAHGGNPRYRSTMHSIDPPVKGLDVDVLNYDDRLLLVNHSGKNVDVRGYGGEPYIRVDADGTVEVNKRSPSYWINLERFGNAQIPASASENAKPRWTLVDKTGRFEWHDHRIHYMAKGVPPRVTDEGKRTKIFDWKVPVDVGSRRVAMRGDLYWVPKEGGGLPRGALIALAAVVVAAIVFVEVVRRRRRPGSAAVR
jgi:hypothetical protein